jgi:hypothetical protein
MDKVFPFRVDMYTGDKRLMLVSFHKTRLDASLKIAEYALEDKKTRKAYRYTMLKMGKPS